MSKNRDVLITTAALRHERTAPTVLNRVAHGWYATDDDLLSPATRALRMGGRLTCLSGLAHYGLWVPPHAGLHVGFGGHQERQPQPTTA